MAETENTVVRACAQCGVGFPDLVGRKGRPRHYCSAACRFEAQNRRNGAKPLAVEIALRKAAAKTAICPGCGIGFRANRNSRLHRHCSRKCAWAALRDPVAAERKLYSRWSARAKRRHDRPLRDMRKTLLESIILYVVNPKSPCLDCGVALGSRHLQKKRCDACVKSRMRAIQRVSESRKAGRRRYRARRRAIERGIEAERFDPFEIFNRDRWSCHICGVKTPKRLRGSFDDRAPELDHIVPLAQGGVHTRMNTACACRKCNGAKGDKPLGQLRLVA
jgi:5-methylcytosine-specific restriction endonuclease McrA